MTRSYDKYKQIYAVMNHKFIYIMCMILSVDQSMCVKIRMKHIHTYMKPLYYFLLCVVTAQIQFLYLVSFSCPFLPFLIVLLNHFTHIQTSVIFRGCINKHPCSELYDFYCYILHIRMIPYESEFYVWRAKFTKVIHKFI